MLPRFCGHAHPRTHSLCRFAWYTCLLALYHYTYLRKLRCNFCPIKFDNHSISAKVLGLGQQQKGVERRDLSFSSPAYSRHQNSRSVSPFLSINLSMVQPFPDVIDGRFQLSDPDWPAPVPDDAFVAGTHFATWLHRKPNRPRSERRH